MMRRRWVSSRLQDIEYGQDMELHRPVMPVEVLEHLAASRGESASVPDMPVGPVFAVLKLNPLSRLSSW